MAERCRIAIRALGMVHAGSEKGVITISCGVATLKAVNTPSASANLLRRADGALYRAKLAGRDCVCRDPGEGFASDTQGSRYERRA